MSQHWHGHWIEDSFKPTRLMNWEIPKWYPNRPDKHCTTTKFVANDRGYILNPKNKLKESTWGDFKGTWDLPKKIDKSTATKLSAVPDLKKKVWELHVRRNLKICETSKGPSIKRRAEGFRTGEMKSTAEYSSISKIVKAENKSKFFNGSSIPRDEALDVQTDKKLEIVKEIESKEDIMETKENLGDTMQSTREVLQESATADDTREVCSKNKSAEACSKHAHYK